MVQKILNINSKQYNFKNTNILNRYSQKNTVSPPSANIELTDSLKDYNFAYEYYNNNLNNNKPVINDVNLLLDVVNNPKSKQNLLLFFSERAKQEANLLKQKKHLSEDEKQKLEGYKEIINNLPSFDDYLMVNRPSFKGSQKNVVNPLTPVQRRNSHIAIHAASAICGGLSAAMGEGAAVGADTPFLWGTQGAMFLALQKTLHVNTMDHAMYIARQFMQGQVLGVQGAKVITSWLGIGVHAVSGGTASVPITAAVRSVNAGLSTSITEKMGWGYVSAFENDNMKLAKQSLQTGLYWLGAELFGHGVNTIFDTANPDDIQAALDAIPKETMSAYGNIMKTLLNNVHVDRFAFMFVADIAQKVLFTDGTPTKDELKSSLKTAILNTVIYDLMDYKYNEVITNDAKETVSKIAEEFKNDPSIWKEFEKGQQKLFTEIDIDKLSVYDFQKKFKDKAFVYNLAMISKDITNDLADKWRKRNFVKLKEERKQVTEDDNKIKSKEREIDRKLTPEQVKNLSKDLEEIVTNISNNVSNPTRGKYGLQQIAGYNNTKKKVNELYLFPAKLEQKGFDVEIPGAILFYGPSGTGKTTIGRTIGEEGSKFVTKKRSIDIANCEQLLSWLNAKGEEAQALFEKTNRRTIVQLNEFGTFNDASNKDIENFINFIDTCSEKYHMTLFLTTNDPLTINEKILTRTKNIPMGPANENDVQNILKYYIGNKKINNLDYKLITNEILKYAPNKYYSNAQLEYMVEQLPSNKELDQSDLMTILEKMHPLIDKDKIDKFISEKEELNKEEVSVGN